MGVLLFVVIMKLTSHPQMRLDTIDSIVELSHVGIQENPDMPKYYVHGNYGEPGSKVGVSLSPSDNQSDPSLQASDMLTMMQSFATNTNIAISNSSSSRIPPASAQSFLKHNSSISTIIISDYDQQYNNRWVICPSVCSVLCSVYLVRCDHVIPF